MSPRLKPSGRNLLLAGFGFVLLAGLPAACERRGADFDMTGVWAWGGVENCGAKGNTLSLKKSILQARYRGVAIIETKDAAWAAERRGFGAVVVVRYRWRDHFYEDSYRVLDADHLAFRGGLIDGRVNRKAAVLEDAQLTRCPAAPPPASQS